MRKKQKHNKKRNTAFLYEALTKELTKSFISKDNSKTLKIKNIIQENFTSNSELRKDLQVYKAFLKVKNDESKNDFFHYADKLHSNIDVKKLFNEQSKLIKDINHELGSEIYENFIPEYKKLATISQYLSEVEVARKVELKNRILEHTTTESTQNKIQHIDNLVYKNFVNNFNKEYSQELLGEQRKLIASFIVTEDLQSSEFLSYMNEEIGRLKKEIANSLSMNEIKEDVHMLENIQKIQGFLEEFGKRSLTENDILSILKIQQLVRETKVD